MKRPQATTTWTAQQWRGLLLVGAVWFPVMVALDVHSRAWWLAGVTGAIGAGFLGLAAFGLLGARRLERQRRGGGDR